MRLLIAFSILTFLGSCHRKAIPTVEKVEPKISIDTTMDQPTGEEDFDEVVIEPILPDTLLFFKQSGCFGQCPVFTLLVMTDTTATYHGKRHVQTVGEYERKLSTASFQEIEKWFDTYQIVENKGSYPKKYEDWIADLPSSMLIFEKDDQSGMIRHNHSGPDAFIQLEKVIYNWTQQMIWTAD